MTSSRAMFRDHRFLVAVIAVMALFAKFMVPQGYMLDAPSHKMMTVQVCFDDLQHKSMMLAVPMNGTDRPQGQSEDPQRNAKCPFTSLNIAAMGGADAPLPALALAFIQAMGFAPVRNNFTGRTAYLRPPSRGPPLRH